MNTTSQPGIVPKGSAHTDRWTAWSTRAGTWSVACLHPGCGWYESRFRTPKAAIAAVRAHIDSEH